MLHSRRDPTFDEKTKDLFLKEAIVQMEDLHERALAEVKTASEPQLVRAAQYFVQNIENWLTSHGYWKPTNNQSNPGLRTGERYLVEYTNWKGVKRQRKIEVMWFWFGSNQYHTVPQWLVHVNDLETDTGRDFAMQDIDPESVKVLPRAT